MILLEAISQGPHLGLGRPAIFCFGSPGFRAIPTWKTPEKLAQE
jgi:hypothetical protein